MPSVQSLVSVRRPLLGGDIPDFEVARRPSYLRPMPQTGPTTPEGKARSSQNAIKHGFYSSALVVADEMLANWQAFLDAFVESLHPESCVEAELACSARA